MVAEAVAIRECEERDLDHFERMWAPRHADYCREQFARGSVALTILVAVDEKDAPTRKAHLDFQAREDAAVLIAALVAPELRGRGMGTELMRAAERFVCDRGLHAIVLGVEDSNPRARRLYERLGYEVIGADNFPYLGAPDSNPGVWMRKELEC